MPTAEKIESLILRAAPELNLWLVTHADLRPLARIRAVTTMILEAIKADRIMCTGA